MFGAKPCILLSPHIEGTLLFPIGKNFWVTPLIPCMHTLHAARRNVQVSRTYITWYSLEGKKSLPVAQ